MLHLNVIGICCFNFLLFSVGFAFISQIFRLNTIQKVIGLTIPTVYIMMIPYSEALFFFLVCALFYGILNNNRWVIWTSLFLAVLTRATGVFLLPSLFVMELLSSPAKNFLSVIKTTIVSYALPIISGLALFVWYQHHVIGVWFAYVIQQRKHEGHEFNWPTWPLGSLEGHRNLWISGMAVFCCFVGILFVIRKAVEWLFKKNVEPNKLLILSLTFLGITLYKTIFYNPTWGINTTLTIGINRYVFATPFFYVLLYEFCYKRQYKPSHFALVFLLSNIAWLACGSFKHLQVLLYFNFCTLLIFAYMLLSDKKLQWIPAALIAINFFLQINMFQQYLSGLYLD